MNRRFAAVSAAGAVLTLSLTGCFGDSGSGTSGGTGAGDTIKLTAAQVLAKTSEKTGQVDTFKASVSMTAAGEAAGNLKASGTMLYRAKPSLAFSMAFNQMNVGGQSMGGMQQVFIDKTFYMKIPMLTQMSGGKPWMKISLADLGEQSGMDFDQLLQQAQQMDPVQTTKLMAGSKDAREVGKETIDGVETTHLTGTYNVSEAVAKLAPEQREAFQKAAKDSGMDTMAFDLWVDDQQLPRKVTMKTAQGAKVPLTVSVVYRDFGQPVDISAPPAAQVTDFSEILKGNTPGGAGN
jgi:LppX_LprAFG lipoprotein